MKYTNEQLKMMRKDKDWCVRRSVATQGHALEGLEDDVDEELRLIFDAQDCALEMLENHWGEALRQLEGIKLKKMKL